MTKETHHVLISYADIQQQLKISSLLSFCQDISSADVASLGVGREKTFDKGYLWVVTRMAFRFTALPKYDTDFLLETWAQKGQHFLFPRNYRLKDKDGTILGEGEAYWILIDSKKRFPLLHPDEKGISFAGDSFVSTLELPLIKPPEDVTPLVVRRTVCYSDCDINGHLSNTRYADFVLDALGGEALKGKRVTAFAIAYEKEARMGEELTLTITHDKNSYYVLGTGNDKKTFEMSVELDAIPD
jgi:medium-chain acyl-[acyl-carrier-protein] hydrolase